MRGVRMVGKSSKQLDKQLVYQDGTITAARVGLVDGCGCMVNLVDENRTEYFKYQPMNEIILEAEAENAELHKAVDIAKKRNKRAIDLLERSIALNEELLLYGGFKVSDKSRFQERKWKINNACKALMREVEDDAK